MPTRRVDLTQPVSAKELEITVDERNGEVLSSEGACRFLHIELGKLEQASHRGALTPFRVGQRVYYTRRDLERYRLVTRAELRDARILRRLRTGEHPVDIYLDMVAQGVTLDGVLRVTKKWARIGGLWLVEGPPGSYSRWLQRMGRTRVKPADIRRCVEDMLLGRVVPQYQETIQAERDPPEAEVAEE